MNKVTITGKMWNEITAVQAQLVLLHNAFKDKHFYLTWHISPWIGAFACTLYSMENDSIKDQLDTFTWYFDTDIEGKTQNGALDKIAEWEKKYGLLDAEH